MDRSFAFSLAFIALNTFASAQDVISISDVPVVAPEAENGPELAGTEGCAQGGVCDCITHNEPWTLFPQRCGGFNIGGWVQGGMTFNNHGNRTATGNTPVAFNGIANEFTVNQAWIYLDKQANNEGCGFDWGFRADYMFGVDALEMQSFGNFGWDWNWFTTNRGELSYGSAIPQLYFDLAFNDLTVKAGYFFTPLGYERFQSPQNFFYSRSHGLAYGLPYRHTGFLAEYALNDCVTLYGGWTFGADTAFDNSHNASTFLGGFNLALAPTTSLKYMTFVGDFGNGAELGGAMSNMFAESGDIYMHSIVFEHELNSRLLYVLEHTATSNQGNINNGLRDANTMVILPGRALPNTESYSISQNLIYHVNDRLSVGTRVEWFRDDDGLRVMLNSQPGPAGDYYAITLGANWRPTANITIRPEVRWDRFSGRNYLDTSGLAGPQYNGGPGTPFDDETSDTLTTFGFDAILTF